MQIKYFGIYVSLVPLYKGYDVYTNISLKRTFFICNTNVLRFLNITLPHSAFCNGIKSGDNVFLFYRVLGKARQISVAVTFLNAIHFLLTSSKQKSIHSNVRENNPKIFN